MDDYSGPVPGAGPVLLPLLDPPFLLSPSPPSPFPPPPTPLLPLPAFSSQEGAGGQRRGLARAREGARSGRQGQARGQGRGRAREVGAGGRSTNVGRVEGRGQAGVAAADWRAVECVRVRVLAKCWPGRCVMVLCRRPPDPAAGKGNIT
jgi:hypothetical protein